MRVLHHHWATPPSIFRRDAAPAGPGGPGLPKEQDERRKCDARGRLWCDDVSSYLTNRQVCWWTSTTRGWGIPDAMCTDNEGRLWRAGFFGATIVLVGPSHRRAVGQDRVPSPSHDVMLLRGGGVGGKSPSHDIMLLQGSRLQWMFVTKTALKFHLLNETCTCLCR